MTSWRSTLSTASAGAAVSSRYQAALGVCGRRAAGCRPPTRAGARGWWSLRRPRERSGAVARGAGPERPDVVGEADGRDRLVVGAVNDAGEAIACEQHEVEARLHEPDAELEA